MNVHAYAVPDESGVFAAFVLDDPCTDFDAERSEHVALGCGCCSLWRSDGGATEVCPICDRVVEAKLIEVR